MNLAVRIACAAALGTTGCEQQFLLVPKDPSPIAVRGSERVERLPPARDGVEGGAFADEGILLQSGTRFPYWREGAWIASVSGVRVQSAGTTTEVSFAVHPGHRDVDLVLATETANVCELCVRERPPRDVAAFLTLAGVIGAAVSVPALLISQYKTAPAVGAGLSGAAIGVGAAMWLWPPGPGRSLVAPCR